MSMHLAESVGVSHIPKVIGLLQHGSITQEVSTKIQPDREYKVIEILPNGVTSEKILLGSVIISDYSDIFGDWKHGFIVYEAGKENAKAVFAYGGPIPQRVQNILIQ